MQSEVPSLLEKIFCVEIRRRLIIDNDHAKITNFLGYIKSNGKKTLLELAIDYFKDLHENDRDQTNISMTRFLTVQNKIIHDKINQFAAINIVDSDFNLENNNWYFLPYDLKLGENFVSNSWFQEDIIFTSAPEIPHLIFTYASHVSKLLEKNEIVTFKNITSVATLDPELTTSPELNSDPNFRWRKKISRNDAQNNQFNLVLTNIIKLKKSRPYRRDEVRYQFFKIYSALLAIKTQGAEEIHFGGKYLEEHVGKFRAIICIFYFAASLAGIKAVYFYSTDGYLDRAEEAIQKYAEFPLEKIISMLSDDCYSTTLLKPERNAAWQWFYEKGNQWKNYSPYHSESFEEQSIAHHSIEYSTNHGNHIVNFDNMTDVEAGRNIAVKIRRVVTEY